MLKKFAIGLICVCAVSAAAGLAACGDDTDYDEKFSDKVKVVYELEGGKYGSSTTSVNHYYDFDGLPITILPLEDKSFSDKGVTRDGGYELDGWYRTKTVEGERVEYSDRWNFTVDKVSKEGVTLYAKWNPPIAYTFDFVYIDDGGAEVVVQSYKVNEGDKFGDIYKNDVLTYATGYAGHTAIAVYYDKEHKVPFDDSIPHPGGEESNAIKIYVEYMDGEYTLVKTKEQLKLARSKNIFLLNDIDMEGAELSFDNYNGKIFEGNGYTVSNFKVSYGNSRFDLVEDFGDDSKKSLCIAIFGNVENAEVRNVTFDGITVEVDMFYSNTYKIYVAPVAVSAKDSKFENVTVNASFGYTRIPEEPRDDKTVFNVATDLVFVTDKGTYVSDNSPETGCTFNITLLGKI